MSDGTSASERARKVLHFIAWCGLAFGAVAACGEWWQAWIVAWGIAIGCWVMARGQ